MWHYFVEVTDTFGGEANYAWARRYRVRSKSMRGAIRAVSRHHGWQRRLKLNYSDFGESAAYDVRGAAVRIFIHHVDGDNATHTTAPWIN